MFSLLKWYTLTIASLCASAVVSADDHNMYVQINAGATFSESYTDGGLFSDSFLGSGTFSYKEKADAGYVTGAALGYRFSDQFRLEGEAMYQSNDLNKSILTANTTRFNGLSLTTPLEGEKERTTFLVNSYYDFKNATPFTPYLSGGVGGYHLRISADRGRLSGENDLDFAWQLGAGLNYRLCDRIGFDLKYRYLSGTEAEVVIPSDFFLRDRIENHDVGDHQIVVGVRVGI